MSEILNDNSQVQGQIYLITNIKTNKQYVGQTLTHRKNRNKYRPFGYIGRFNDHISEAICNTKKKQCTYLNNAIRLDGKDAFTVELLLTSSKEELDSFEEQYIKLYHKIVLTLAHQKLVQQAVYLGLYNHTYFLIPSSILS